jgi:hypothetical protein
LESGLHITTNVLISDNRVLKNGQFIFEITGAAEPFLKSAYTHFEIAYPKFHKMDQLCQLGFLASELLLTGLDQDKKYKDEDRGIVFSNSHGSLDVDLRYAKTIQSGASPALFVYTLPNIVIGEISIRQRIKGENAFFVFNDFDGNFIAEYVGGLFTNNLVKTCICGWVDYFKEDYRALLMLVEKDVQENAMPFTVENINKLNQQDHG